MGSHSSKASDPSTGQSKQSRREWRNNRRSAYGGPDGAYVGQAPYIAGYGTYDDGSTGDQHDVYGRHRSERQKEVPSTKAEEARDDLEVANKS
jgi:hypothetical protein